MSTVGDQERSLYVCSNAMFGATHSILERGDDLPAPVGACTVGHALRRLARLHRGS